MSQSSGPLNPSTGPSTTDPSAGRATGRSMGKLAFRGGRVLTVLALTTLAGLLLWSKLKLVANIPRTAYAEPREVMDAEPEAGSEDRLADHPVQAGAVEAVGPGLASD